MIEDRTAQIKKFLFCAGWPDADHVLLAQDASFRSYRRVTYKGKTAVLMDAPPEREDVRPFLRIAHALSQRGFSAPQIFAEDPKAGLILMEDLGDDTFTRLLDRGSPAQELYVLATDVLIDLHNRMTSDVVMPELKPYSDDLLLAEAALMIDWYLPAVTVTDVPVAARVAYHEIWKKILKTAHALPQTMVLRDFHVDNLILLKGRTGIAACGLLDFQDALVGPVSYDFISLVEDARRAVSGSLKQAMRERYLNALPTVDPDAFDLSCTVLGAQRHCKVLGIFTRLSDRDGKVQYLQHVPRIWNLLELALSDPALTEMKNWFEEFIPPNRRIIPPRRAPK
ncbi:MAG: phosphotransferase [Pseudomonadota bacterium]|nr:phosphotransferase [Pseudomonadota bacterium]